MTEFECLSYTHTAETRRAKVSAKRLALDKGFSVAKRAGRCQQQGQLGHLRTSVLFHEASPKANFPEEPTTSQFSNLLKVVLLGEKSQRACKVFALWLQC